MKKLTILVLCSMTLTINAQSLIAYYPLNGNANDSVSNNNGVLHGINFTSDSHGNSQSAASFNGTNSWIEFGQSSIINDNLFTISLWVKFDTVLPIQPCLSLGYNSGFNNHELTFGLYYTNNIFGTYAGEPYIANPTSSNDNGVFSNSFPNLLSNNLKVRKNLWYQLTIVHGDTGFSNIGNYIPQVFPNGTAYQDSAYKFYINGIRMGNPSTKWSEASWYGTNFPFPINNTMALGVSQGASTNKKYFSGTMDEVRIYSGALSDQQVLDLYSQSVSGINELELVEFNIFPNPSNGFFYVKNKNIKFQYIVFNSIGQTVTSNKIENYQFNIDLSNESPGIYFLETFNNDFKKTTKLVIN